VGEREGNPSSNRNFDFQEPTKISIFLVQWANQNGSLWKKEKLRLGGKHYLLGTLWYLDCGIIYNRIISSYDLVYTLVANKIRFVKRTLW
jgi:hypothetical protein